MKQLLRVGLLFLAVGGVNLALVQPACAAC